MLARIKRDEIIVQEARNHWDLRPIIDDLNNMFLARGVKPIYFFTGMPGANSAGLTMIIKLPSSLRDEDIRALKRYFQFRHIRVFIEQ